MVSRASVRPGLRPSFTLVAVAERVQIQWDTACVGATDHLGFRLEVDLSEEPDEVWRGGFHKATAERQGSSLWQRLLVSGSAVYVEMIDPVEKGDIETIREELEVLVRRADELAAPLREQAEQLAAEFRASPRLDPHQEALEAHKRDQDQPRRPDRSG
jgi:hypothetical protein